MKPAAAADAEALRRQRLQREQRLAQLLRMSRREGQIHPLQHLIERYRNAEATAQEDAR